MFGYKTIHSFERVAQNLLLLTRFLTEICQKNVYLKHASHIFFGTFTAKVEGYIRMVQIRATADRELTLRTIVWATNL